MQQIPSPNLQIELTPDFFLERLEQKNIPYASPFKFSDPCHDFDGLEDILSEICHLPLEAVKAKELRYIFNGFLPAGTYEEVVYYLPRAFEECCETAEITLLDNVLIWIGEHKELLASDNLLSSCLAEIAHLFEVFSRNLSFIRQDAFIYVEHFEMIEYIMSYLCSYKQKIHQVCPSFWDAMLSRRFAEPLQDEDYVSIFLIYEVALSIKGPQAFLTQFFADEQKRIDFEGAIIRYCMENTIALDYFSERDINPKFCGVGLRALQV